MKTRNAIILAAALVFLGFVLASSRIFMVIPAWLVIVPICLAVGFLVWKFKK